MLFYINLYINGLTNASYREHKILTKTDKTKINKYLPMKVLKLRDSFFIADENSLEDISILYVDKNITNINNNKFDGKIYISAFKIPFILYLANILLIEKLIIKLLKNTIIKIIGIPIMLIPKSHIIDV